MILIETIAGLLALVALVDSYRSLLRYTRRIHIADWRTGAQH
jgi:hypothetical protein